MKITYRGDYALKAILSLARTYGKELVTIHDLARRIDAPEKFLEQVLLDLKKAGFVESRRGKVGGYLLAKPPSAITVGDVVRFMEGPVEPIGCVKEGYTRCRDLERCIFRGIWQKVDAATSAIIDTITFEDLVAQVEAGSREPAYFI